MSRVYFNLDESEVFKRLNKYIVLTSKKVPYLEKKELEKEIETLTGHSAHYLETRYSKAGIKAMKNPKDVFSLKVGIFQRYCKKVDAFFLNDDVVGLTNPKHKEHHTLYLQWRNDAYKRLDWPIPGEESKSSLPTVNEIEITSDMDEMEVSPFQQVSTPHANIVEAPPPAETTSLVHIKGLGKDLSGTGQPTSKEITPKTVEITEEAFMAASEIIAAYYKNKSHLQHEIDWATYWFRLVRNRNTYENDPAIQNDFGRFIRDFSSLPGWEIYERMDDLKTVRRSLRIPRKEDVVSEYFYNPDIIKRIRVGEKGRNKRDAAFSDWTDVIIDLAQRKVEIGRHQQNGTRSTFTTYSFSITSKIGHTYLGHKCVCENNPNLGSNIFISPAVLHCRQPDDHENYREFFDPNDKGIPNIVRTFLLNWRELKLDQTPFTNVVSTVFGALDLLSR